MMVKVNSRKLISIIFLLLPFLALSQQKVGNNVVIDYEGDPLYQMDSSKFLPKKLQNKISLKDSFLLDNPALDLDTRDPLEAANTINKKIINKEEPESVFTKKEWREYPDSLISVDGVNVPIDMESINKTTIPIKEDDLLGILNSKINNESKSEADASNMHSNAIGEMAGEKDALLSDIKVNDLKLEPQKLEELPSLPSDIVDSHHLKSIDSIKDITLKNERLTLDEEKMSSKMKVAKFERKKNFWDKSYFDGVVGFFNDEGFVMQASPSLGYYLTNQLSIGLGPNILLSISESNTDISLGVRNFLKYEIYDKRAYFQLEDNVSEISYNNNEDRLLVNNHDVLLGAGYVLSTKSKLTLNFALFYQLLGSPVNQQLHPFVLRIGISSVKKVK